MMEDFLPILVLRHSYFLLAISKTTLTPSPHILIHARDQR